MNRGRHPVMHERMVAVGGVRLCVRTSGERDHRAVLLIGGAHCSMDCWDDRLCEKIAANGRFVIRYDQRDTGRSACDPAGHPSYGFDELVADAAGVLDVLGVAEADVAGLSLGGGVAQRLALDHSPKVRSLTLISTSPGLRPGVRSDADLPSMSPSLRRHFVATRPEPDWASRTVAINELVAEQRRLAGTGAFDEHTVRRLAERVLNRSSDVAAAQTNHGLLPSGASYRPLPTRSKINVLMGPLDPACWAYGGGCRRTGAWAAPAGKRPCRGHPPAPCPSDDGRFGESLSASHRVLGGVLGDGELDVLLGRVRVLAPRRADRAHQAQDRLVAPARPNVTKDHGVCCLRARSVRRPRRQVVERDADQLLGRADHRVHVGGDLLREAVLGRVVQPGGVAALNDRHQRAWFLIGGNVRAPRRGRRPRSGRAVRGSVIRQPAQLRAMRRYWVGVSPICWRNRVLKCWAWE